MFKYYIGVHVLLFTMYACSMGSKKARIFKTRDTEKTIWAFCDSDLLVQNTKTHNGLAWVSLKIKDRKRRDLACLRRCEIGQRKKSGKCKQYEVLTRPFTDDKFYHGQWLLMPEV